MSHGHGDGPGVRRQAVDTQSRRLAVRTVLGATLLEVVVPTTDTRVRIWANTPAEPTALTIGVARAAAGIAR